MCGGASTTSSGGSPMAATTARATASRKRVARPASPRAALRPAPPDARCRWPGRGCRRPPRSPCARRRTRTDGLLDLLRIEVAPAADDDVLDAAGDVEIVADPVGAVAAVQPAVVEQASRLLRVAEVALRGRRAAEPEPALDALADVAPVVVDEAHFVPGQRRAAGHEAQRAGIAAPAGRRGARARRARAGCGRSRRHAPERREQQARPSLGQAVDRRHAPRRAGRRRRSAAGSVARCRG